MQKAVFKESGTLSCRGEEVSSYTIGDEVTILDSFNEDIYQVIINNGDSEGTMAYIDKDKLDLVV